MTTISNVRTIGVPVADQDAALAFCVDTGIRFTTPDAAAEHAAMTAAGVDVDELLLWDTAPPMFDFRDPDGNTYYVSQVD